MIDKHTQTSDYRSQHGFRHPVDFIRSRYQRKGEDKLYVKSVEQFCTGKIPHEAVGVSRHVGRDIQSIEGESIGASADTLQCY